MKTTLLLFASLGFCLVARAESPDSIPNPRKTNRSSIYDGARVLNDAEKHRIDDAINAFQKRTKGEMMVVTVQTLDGQTIEEWSNTLFRRIGIGRKGKDDGVLFVFAIQDRKSRIEVGYGLEDKLTDARAGDILRDLRPAFRRSAYGQGILEGVQAAIRTVEGSGRPAPRATSKTTSPTSSSSSGSSSPGGSSSSGYIPPSTSYPQPSSSGGSGGFPGGLLLMGMLVVGGVGAAVYVGSRPKRCPQCNGPMTESEAPDADLTEAQRVERGMGSRTFKLCKCPKCGYSNIEHKDVLFSGITWCNRCRNMTARTHKHVMSDPTYDYEGEEEVIETCEYPPCRYIARRTQKIPRKVRPSHSSSAAGGFIGSSSSDSSWSSSSSSDSSSSSSSSYDGGSSSSYSGGDSGGGGASSDW